MDAKTCILTRRSVRQFTSQPVSREALEEIDRMKAEVLRIQGSAVCPNCGMKMPEGAAFCSSCGAKMNEGIYEE